VDTEQIQQEIRAREIAFPNGNRARLVEPPAGANAADIIRALDIRQPQVLVLVIGGARGFDAPAKSRLTQMFSRGVARAVVDVGGLIIDGGTEAGVMSMIGQGVADRGRKTPLLGVVPAGKVTYPGGPAEGSIEDGAPLDPNHSHFVLVDSDVWGGETATMYALAETLVNRVLGPPMPVDDSTDGRAAAQPASATIPVVTVLAGGNTQGIAKDEALASVRCGWPIIVIEGSGRLADEIAHLWRKKQRIEARRTPGRWNAIRRRARLWRQPALAIDDPALAEIIEEGDIQLVPLNGQVADLRHLINRLLRPPRSMTPLDLA
jgi:SLOG in TRPM, prokaryote